MKFKARLVQSVGLEEQVNVEQAVITAERISLDWSQHGRSGHLIAKSPNGVHFQGRYGYLHEHLDFDCDLTLYKAQHEDLLYGAWRDPATGVEGTLVVRLPVKVADTRPPASAPAGEDDSALDAQPPAVEPPPAPGRVFAGAAKPAAAAVDPAGNKPPAPISAKPGATAPAVSTAPPVTSAQADHLLSLTDDEFADTDRVRIERELCAAPVSALFKVARNALAAELRALAARMFAERNGDLTVESAPVPPPRPAESPEARARKRRSSRHWQNR